MMDAFSSLTDARWAELEAAAARFGARLESRPEELFDRSADLELNMPGRISPNGHCRLIEASDGWIAVNLAREDDVNAVPAWTGCALDADPWQAIQEAALTRTAAELLEGAVLLQLPVSIVGEARGDTPFPDLRPARRTSGKVIDISALWAGPLCGGLLAEAGLEVIKVEAPNRPDPTPAHLPNLDQRLNGRKMRLPMDLAGEELARLIDEARILITSARPLALERLGLTPERLFARNPDLLWIAITAHGFAGDGAGRVGFGDDCAAAGGLVHWEAGVPSFMGDALADPLTGVRAATLAFSALADGDAGLLDVSLSGTAALC
jgi:hypothetical protein